MSDARKDLVFGPYHNGREEIYADPAEIYRKLLRGTRGELSQLIEQSRAEGPANAEDDDTELRRSKEVARSNVEAVAFNAIERLLPVVRDAFGMAPFDPKTGTGALEMDCVGTLNRFLWFLADEKKSTGS